MLIALVLSLAMNAGIIGMLLVQWLSPKQQTEQVQRWQAYRREGLGIMNAPELRQHNQDFRKKNQAKIMKSQEARRSFVSSLQAQPFDEAKTRKLLKEYLEARSGMEMALGESMISLKKNIRDPQAMQAFNSRIRQRSTQLEKLAGRDSLASDSLRQFRRPLRARVLNRLRQRRGALN